MQHRIVLGLGSNLGDSATILGQAVESLSAFITDLRKSSTYQTEPVGGPVQPRYWNAVLVGLTDLEPEELLLKTQQIEARYGRLRTVRWGPRTLDIDLIDYDGIIWDSPTLILPHPLAHQRAFVLVPWNEVDPEAILIGHGFVKSILKTLDLSVIVR
ncbi:MAG TPA: 2-amino-4-hydroxy-6-hydroxymethyldihydropteridine diphosphokinase [Candidatus Nanopelagicaceae bacterium]|nr:2-amino-4-hydroxy-6-hydroxymethyldihydropteridine diphosphokinase [Candidatus Nanopelagicaceae bacterium]